MHLTGSVFLADVTGTLVPWIVAMATTFFL